MELGSLGSRLVLYERVCSLVSPLWVFIFWAACLKEVIIKKKWLCLGDESSKASDSTDLRDYLDIFKVEGNVHSIIDISEF